MEGWTEEEEEEQNMSKKIICWNEEARKLYRERTEAWNVNEDQEIESVDRKWEKIKNWILGALVYKEIKIKKRRKIGHKDWWDRSCTRKKREVKRQYRRWRSGKGSKEDYLEGKKGLKGWLEKKRMEKREREEEELRKLKDEKKIWNYINSRRKKKEWKENNIPKENWRSYFMELLGGSEMEGRDEALEVRDMGTEERNEEQVQDIEMELQEEEIVRAVRNMKLGKAAGVDGIPMEAWLYGGAAVRRALTDLLKLIWKEGKIPTEWRTSIVVPLYKRGDKERTDNYRGISLLCTAYKVYAEILRNRLEEIMEMKGMIPDSQAGFRKGRSTMDNIFILNHIVQREKEKGMAIGKDKIFAIFVDLRAAFDNVDRGILWKIMEEKGVDRSLINRIKEIYKETEVTIRTRDGFTRCFKTKKGVRQGCVMSPALFNLYNADIDKVLEKRGIGGVELGGVRVWSLAYADDMVLVAKNRKALLDMMSMLKRFLKERKLELNTEKTKVLVFNSKGKRGRMTWKWGEKIIEEVEMFKYLGFTFNRKGNYIDHIKELKRKGRIAANRVWGLGERLCKDDFSRRWTLFKYLVKSVMEYGAEIWGWSEKKELEKVMLDYVRWIFRLDFCTPRYVILRELGLEKLKICWGIRAMRFEKRSRGKKDGSLVKACWDEKETRDKKKKDLYNLERERFYNNNGWSSEVIKELNYEGKNTEGLVRIREQDIQGQIINSKIVEARYNTRYKVIKASNKTPSYLLKANLDKVKTGNEIRAMVKLRCGNFEDANKYWLDEEDTKCRFCKSGRDNLEHYISECNITSTWFENLGRNNEERLENICDDKFRMEKGKVLNRLWKRREEYYKKDNGCK
ncbi:uncharacterized protein [Temnothorax nylanderi]|uniref:uncharacterized protein n=1 Tax=Temnothorax nylanderi TaxID=102681 RepID=UPI003A8747A7